ncbi:MAG: class I SAM-dependent methyltransferase [Proteobacteria bacterium]|nr:class I SAM-dependent methyltransferase [Pseudomonadota bacterium]
MSAPEEMTNAWEAAYQRFETREQEMQKFLRRLRKAGAPTWRKEAQVVEIFCGRGTGLHALQHLGFKRLEGVDFSAASRDIVIVQGGLHHLPELPADLEKVVSEVRRVLRPGGRFMVVEPWRTPFLRFVHWVGSFKFARRAWDKLDALETMTELEWVTYDQWLLNPDLVLRCLDGNFVTERKLIGWGKLMWVGRNGVISA